MTIDLSPEELALCAQLLRERETKLDVWTEAEENASLRAGWMRDAHAAGCLAHRIELQLSAGEAGKF